MNIPNHVLWCQRVLISVAFIPKSESATGPKAIYIFSSNNS